MSPRDPLIFRELQVIHKIIDDEIWLEGERRGCSVPPDDPVVSENVYRVIMRIGAQLHETLLEESPPAPDAEMVQHEAA